MIAVDAAYVRVGAPDLDLMEAFLLDFGMVRADRTADALYMAGFGPDPVVHITERTENPGVGFALKMRSRADLDALAARFGAEVRPREEPGGGEVVRFEDPDGNRIEAVFGLETVERPAPRAPFVINGSISRERQNAVVRLEPRPSHVVRLGHVALFAADFPAMRAFYCDLLGMRVSDSYYAGHEDNMMGAFLHCGLGQTYVDHHTIALVGNGRRGVDHMAFEVLDIDDLMMGSKHLRARDRWRHSWGVGRHNDGSQVFDYWRDPFDNKVEHWTDGDLVNDDYRGGHMAFDPETAVARLAQWAPPLSPDFMR